MTSSRTQEVLYESEAALRLVDHELHQLHDIQTGAESLSDSVQTRAVNEASAQIMDALVRLRERTAAGPLSDAADLLREMERRMTAVSKLLDASREDEPSHEDSVIFKKAV